MSDPKGTLPNGADDELEYVGHLKFGPAAGEPITPETTMEDWEHTAKHEYVFNQMAIHFCNLTDEEMEAWILERVSRRIAVSFLADTAEFARSWIDKKKAGVDVYENLFTRCIIIGERIEARYLSN